MGLDKLVSLGNERLRQVATVLRSELPCPRTQLRRSLEEKVGLSSEESQDLLQTVVPYLLRSVPGGPLHGRVWEKLLKDAQEKFGEQAVAELSQQRDVISDILSVDNAIALKGALLQQRVVPHVAGFGTVVDLRPVFDDKHQEVVAFVPVVILQLNLHSDGCDEIGSHCFQLPPETMRRMIETLSDADSKVRVLLDTAKKSQLRVLE